MSAAVFFGSLGVTTLLLLATIATGWTGRRRAHIPLALTTVVSLGFAITQARLYGEGFIIPPDRLRIHLSLAFSALGVLPAAALSGVLLIRRPRVRPWHRFLAWSFVVLTLAAMATATWMLLGATPK